MTTQQDILRTMMTQLDDARIKSPKVSTSSSVIISRIFTLANPPQLLSSDLRVHVDVVAVTTWVTIGVAAPTMRVTSAHLIQHTRMGKHQPKLVSREKLFFVQTTRTGVALMGVESTLRLIYQKPSSLGRADATPAHTRILVLDLKFVWRGSIRRILGCRRR